jgi:hypothetical protein
MNAKKATREANATSEKAFGWDEKEFKGQEARNVMRDFVGSLTPQDGTRSLMPFYYCPRWRSITLSRPIMGEPVYQIVFTAHRLSLTRRATLSLSFREAEIQHLEMRGGKGFCNRGDIEIKVFLDSGVIQLDRRRRYSPFPVVGLICAVFPFFKAERVEVRMWEHAP